MSLQLLANSSISQSRFALEYTAIESSIVVEIDGIVHTNWTFDTNTNEVVLQSNIPVSGNTITIEYTELASCEE